VLQYQVVQRADGLLVRVVVGESAARDLPDRVRRAVQEALDDAGAALPVLVEVVPEIERQAGHAGKLKLVVSRVSPPA
jgi:ATP sulfurylase